jgi:hypothetical protein
MLALIFFLVLCIPAFADTTLEILDIDFPDNCGASFTTNAVECSRCHFPDNDYDLPSPWLQLYKDNPNDFRTISSLEENNSITAIVPVGEIRAGEPLTQVVSISGLGTQYQFGYTRNQEPFVLLENRWLSRASVHTFFQQNNGIELPILDEPGEYIFRINFLHRRNPSQSGKGGWARTILLWTINIIDDEK